MAKLDSILIVIADQHPALRKGIITSLKAHRRLRVVGEAEDGRAAIKIVRSLKPDVVITDIPMPKLNGLEAAHHMKKLQPNIRILVFSDEYEDRYIEKAVAVKVDGFLIKSTPAEVLPKAVILICEGKPVFSPIIERHIRQHAGYPGYAAGNPSHLTPREIEVMHLLPTCRSKEIGYELDLSTKTIERHIERIKTKLNIKDVAGLIRYVIKSQAM